MRMHPMYRVARVLASIMPRSWRTRRAHGFVDMAATSAVNGSWQCGQAAPAGLVDPFARNCTAAYEYGTGLAGEWCHRERRLLEQPISSTAAAKAGLHFNEFGISFDPSWSFTSEFATSTFPRLLFSNVRPRHRSSVLAVLQHDLRPAHQLSQTPDRHEVCAADDDARAASAHCQHRKWLHELQATGAVPIRWGAAATFPASSLEGAEGFRQWFNATNREAVTRDHGIRISTCPGAHPRDQRRAAATRHLVLCRELQRLTDFVVPRMHKLASSYMGNGTTYVGLQILQHPSRDVINRPKSAFFASGIWHHDRCGRRLKCFVFWSKVTPSSHPPKIAVGSQNTLFYAYDSFTESRFAEDAVAARYNITAMLGEPGDGFCFDTNSIHKGELLGSEMRTVVIFEFDAAGHRQFCPYAS